MDFTRQVIHYKTDEEWLELRKHDITSTETPCLFDQSEWMSYYELWMRKRHPELALAIEENERMKYGKKFEPIIAEILAEKYGWEIEPFKVYMRIPELRLGSSFDYRITKMGGVSCDTLLEIKNVDGLVFQRKWSKDEFNMEAPLYIEFQCQAELLVSGKPNLILGACIGGNRDEKIERTPDQNVWEALIAKSKEFWDSIDAGNEPKPDFQKDAKFVTSLYQSAEPGTVMDADDRITILAQGYKVALENEKQSKEEKEGFKAEMLSLIGDTEKVTGMGFTISAGIIGPVMIEAYEREGYRNFKVNFKKEKKTKEPQNG